MALPYVILNKHNIAKISKKTNRSEFELAEILIRYADAGIYPVKIPTYEPRYRSYRASELR